jgi:hypothetical protein
MKIRNFQILLIFLVLTSLVLLVFVSCEGDVFNDCLSGRGNPATERRGLYPFKNVAVYDNINLDIEQGEKYEIYITSGDKLNRMIGTLIENNTLKISNESACNLLKDPWKPVFIRLIVPAIDTLFVHNHGEINTLGAYTVRKFSIIVSACPAIVKLELNTSIFKLEYGDGSADIHLSGYSRDAYIYNGGYGKVDALEFSTKYLVVNSRSSNNTWVRGGDLLLDVKIESLGDVYYTNRPEKIITYLYGTGKLIPMD